MLEVPKISDATAAFPASPPLPKLADIPEAFRRDWDSQSNPYTHAAAMLFYKGGKLADFGLSIKDGLDKRDVMRALGACLGSFAPSHEHKMAGVAFMLSEWCDHKGSAP